ncbi:hypothetical protein ACWE42_07515 [Sutcliffiella cohnii]
MKGKIQMIPANKINVENIDPFLGKDQVIEEKEYKEFDVKVTLYYHDKKDCLMVKGVCEDEIFFHELGGRGTFEATCNFFESLLNGDEK